MRVTVLFFGVLKDLVGRPQERVEVAPGTTVGQLFDSYAQRFGTLTGRRSSILFARNQEFAKDETVLTESDEIAFLPPVSGGSGRRLFQIARDPISSGQLSASLATAEDGAVVTFEGIVRNNSGGRATDHLYYDCYEAMALKEMERIGEEVASQFQLTSIGIIHRIGELAVGEASVVIVASAPHRRPAFAGALEAIDRLKREVAIWKKEVFADGEEWLEGEWDSRLLRAQPGP